ncbi:hypothetical protein JA1_004280 [Spathaspora sp. JA1]|nr:hypothetical protein JA1_004280 [Spathaspora sp. JA1]
MKLIPVFMCAALAVASHVVNLPKPDLLKRDNEECQKSCVQAGQLQMNQCKDEHASNDALLVNACVCSLGDEYWNLMSSCINGCDEYAVSGAPKDAAGLKKVYCQAVAVHTPVAFEASSSEADKAKTSTGNGNKTKDEVASGTTTTKKNASETGESETTKKSASESGKSETEKSSKESTTKTDDKSSSSTETNSESESKSGAATALGVGSFVYLMAVILL